MYRNRIKANVLIQGVSYLHAIYHRNRPIGLGVKMYKLTYFHIFNTSVIISSDNSSYKCDKDIKYAYT